jgi:hypothetical protein
LIEAHQITVVVQGPIIPNDSEISTRSCLESIRRHLPGARIILSTWKDSCIANLDFDLCIESEDPGNLLADEGIAYNVNRQIVATLIGLERASTPYALKMRTDCHLTGNAFVQAFAKHRTRHKSLNVFCERIVCTDLYFRTPHKNPHQHLFHPSDVFQFGLLTDLLKLWKIPCARKEEVLLPSMRSVTFLRRDASRIPLKLAEEQYIWLACLRKSGFPYCLDYSWQTGSRLTLDSELSIINNFVPASATSLGVALPRRFQDNGPEGVYKYEDFLELENLYCNPRATTLRIAKRSALLWFQCELRNIRNLKYRVLKK